MTFAVILTFVGDFDICGLYRVSPIPFLYASAHEVAGGIMFSGRPSVRPYIRTYVRPSRFIFVDISRTVRWFYIKLGVRVYPGGIILCLDFRVTGSKVTGSCCKNMEVLVITCT